MTIKKLLSYIFEKQHIDRYLIIKILGIKITLKPYKLKSRILSKRLNLLLNKINENKDEIKKYFNYIFINNKDKIDYSKLIGDIPYVSIIVPVYNIGKKLLTRCLNSLVNQTLRNIEIIIINDCSPLEEDDIICREYSNKDKRIKYIYNKINMGSGGARLEGLKYVTGYSIAFVDSDDYVKLETYEMALFTMFFYNTDIVSFGLYEIKSSINEIYLGNLTAYNNITKYLLNHRVCCYMYNKLYKTSILLDIDKKCIPADMIGEDRVYNFLIFNKAESLSIIPVSLYYYDRNVEQAQTYLITDKYIYGVFHSYEIIITIIEKNNMYIKQDINISYAITIYNTFLRIFDEYKNINKNKYYELINYMKNTICIQLKKYYHILNISQIYDYLQDKYLFSNDFTLFINQIQEIEIQKFISSNIDKNYVLIAELNDCHGEVIPGIVKYMLDLSYKVDILITHKQSASGVLEIFNDNNNVRIFSFDRESLINIIKDSNLNKYRCIFITSYYLYYTYYNWPCLIDYIKNIDKKNKKLIIMEHHLDLVNEKFRKKSKISVMHKLNEDKFPIWINPHYFGNIKITGKNNNIIKFIVVGIIEQHRKNFDILFEGFNKLLNDGFTNFKLIIVGKGDITSSIGSLYNFIDIKGRLNYNDMYKEIENSDFFLPLLDSENPAHDRYVKYGVSGSFQLIYGFLKPAVINEKFTYKYGFNDGNSIIYKTNDNFTEALKIAMNMTDKNYTIMQNNLKKYADELYAQSLINLKNIIGSNKVI